MRPRISEAADVQATILSHFSALEDPARHWKVRVLDVVFHDDLLRLRTENGPANMATIKHAARNIIKQIPDKASLKIKKKTDAWNDAYLSDAPAPMAVNIKRFFWTGPPLNAINAAFRRLRLGAA